MFIFQPAEEGPPTGEHGGVVLMLKQGLFSKVKPDAIFGVHVWPGPAGQLQVEPEGIMAAADSFEITVKGVQVHGSSPWRGARCPPPGARREATRRRAGQNRCSGR